MEIEIPPGFIDALKDNHLLIDANVFRDATVTPTEYIRFFNSLKKHEVTISTIDCVKFELLKGFANDQRYYTTERHINSIIEVIIPMPNDYIGNVYDLIKSYGIDGAGVSITDLFLGVMLIKYGKRIFLMTRDTSDFIQRLFTLQFIVNHSYMKGIHTYGIYQYL